MDQERPDGGERLQEAAGGLLDQAGRTAESQASRTMTRAGETLDQVARAVREAGSGLRGERPEIAEFADTAAVRVEEAASYLRVHDASEVLDEATRFARQQPVLVVGGALLAGLAIGRLLKSSTSMASGVRSGMYGQSDFRRSSYGGSTYDARPGTGYQAGSDYDAATPGGTTAGMASTRPLTGTSTRTPTARSTSASTTGSPTASTSTQTGRSNRTGTSRTSTTQPTRTSGGSIKER
jgi:ElaB/YqjD/DUF883 family membrane-anchored ribosome-binding protein